MQKCNNNQVNVLNFVGKHQVARSGLGWENWEIYTKNRGKLLKSGKLVKSSEFQLSCCREIYQILVKKALISCSRDLLLR